MLFKEYRYSMKLQWLVYLSLLMLCSAANAADKALLIGVGQYQNNIHDLPGVAIDIETMKDSARILGFKPENIKVLQNEQVTKKNLIATIENWLIKDIDEQDKVLIYFSGHGSRIPDTNNDEEDGADEVLVLYDSRIRIDANNKRTLENVLVDDELNELLQRIKSQDMMLMVDACNSGTVYRGVASAPGRKAVSKFFSYRGMPRYRLQMKSVDSDDNAEQPAQLIDVSNDVIQRQGVRFVALTAAGDNELALATRNGSIFTQGVNYYLKQAALTKTPLTPQELMDKVAVYIEKTVKEEKLGAVYQPRIAGNLQLVNKALKFVPIPNARVNWNRLQQLDIAGSKLQILTARTRMKLGELLTIDIKIPHAGYLNIMSVDANDEVSVLYPNPWEPENYVDAGNFHLPTPKMDFDLQITEPAGENLLVAVLTTEPVNLYKQTIQGRDNNGQMFGRLTQIAAQLKDRGATKDYLSGRLVISAY